ncbi:MAG: uracil phosphoribosyltransferase, partial [Exiguobacterium sp.]|nr:uracil phosphoribosyltransferase [Exiguobacterium sp.]
MGKVHVYDHPLIQHKMTIMRKVETGTKQFRELVDEVSSLMAYEITRSLPLTDVEIETPVSVSTQKM